MMIRMGKTACPCVSQLSQRRRGPRPMSTAGSRIASFLGGAAARFGKVPWREIREEAFDRAVLVLKAACFVHVVNTYVVGIAFVSPSSTVSLSPYFFALVFVTVHLAYWVAGARPEYAAHHQSHRRRRCRGARLAALGISGRWGRGHPLVAGESEEDRRQAGAGARGRRRHLPHRSRSRERVSDSRGGYKVAIFMGFSLNFSV